MTQTAILDSQTPSLPCWDLSDLYEGMECDALKNDIANSAEKAQAFANEYQGSVAELSADTFAKAIAEYEEIEETLGRLASYAYLVYAENMSDSERAGFFQNTSETINDISSLLLFFTLEIARIENDAIQEKLLVKAPLNGVIVDVADSLQPGRWINDEVALAYLVTENERDLVGYVEEQELKRIILDSPGVFYPENPEHETVEVKLTELASSGQRQLREPYFASRLGGPIAVRQDRSGKDIPTTAIYRVRFEMPNGLPDYAGYRQAIRGSVRLEVQKASFFSRFVETAASVLIREAGI